MTLHVLSVCVLQALNHWFTLGSISHKEMAAGTFHKWQKSAKQLFGREVGTFSKSNTNK